MIRNNTAMPSSSMSHTISKKDLSSLEHPRISQPLTTHSKINGLPTEALQEIRKIADASIQNKEKRDNLLDSIRLADSKIKALEKKEQNSQNESPRKSILREAISSITQNGEVIRERISNLSRNIQLLEKKQQQQADFAKKREREFNKHFSDYKELLKSKKDLEANKSVLSEQYLALQNGMHVKKADIESLKSKMESLDTLIKKALEGKVGEIYKETIRASTLLLKKKGMQILPGGAVEELTKYLCEMTDHLSKSEQIKYVEEKYSPLALTMLMVALAINMAISISDFEESEPSEMKIERLSNKKVANPHEEIHINEQYKLANMAHTKKWHQMLTPMTTAVLFVIMCIFLVMRFKKKSKEKEIAKIRSEHKLPQRTLKKEIINSEKSAEEELFNFAFSLVEHANMELIKSPLKTMAEEVSRLVMEVRMNGETSIKIDAVDKEKINEYLARLKDTLKRKSARLEEKLDIEIDKNGRNHDKTELSDLSEKADFVKQFLINSATKAPINNEAKAVCDIADKAKFINEFSKIFNNSNEAMIADAIRNMIVSMSQEIIRKLSATDAGSINPETSSFERRIKDAEQKKQTFAQPLQQANTEFNEIVQKNEKIEENIQYVEKEIKSKKFGMSDSVEAMAQIPFSQNQLAVYEPELSDAGIHIKPKDEYAGLTPKKSEHVKAQQRENEKRLALLLEEHDNLHDQYSVLQKEKREKEDELEKIEFLEMSNKGEQLRKFEENIKTCKKEIGKLMSEEKNLLNALEKINPLRDLLTLNAIKRVRRRHLAQSDKDLQKHAQKNVYSSNYRSVGHFLKSCLDIHTSLQQEIEASGVPELRGYFVESNINIADGMNRNFRKIPISASVVDIVEIKIQGEKKYLIDHIYGFVPRGFHVAK